jgi:hypothetical protein
MGVFKILVGILRHYVTVLLTSPPKKLSRAAIREQCVLCPVLHQLYIYASYSDAHSCALRYFVPHHPTHLFPLHTTSPSLPLFGTLSIQARISKTARQRIAMHQLRRQIRSQTPTKWKE